MPAMMRGKWMAQDPRRYSSNQVEVQVQSSVISTKNDAVVLSGGLVPISDRPGSETFADIFFRLVLIAATVTTRTKMQCK